MIRFVEAENVAAICNFLVEFSQVLYALRYRENPDERLESNHFLEK